MLSSDVPDDRPTIAKGRTAPYAGLSCLPRRPISSASWLGIHSTNAHIAKLHTVFSFAAFNGGNLPLVCGTASSGAALEAACSCFPYSASMIESVGGGMVGTIGKVCMISLGLGGLDGRDCCSCGLHESVEGRR